MRFFLHSPRGHVLSASALQPRVCRYGTKLACCYGWRRSGKGGCEATCEPGCKFGECVGPNQCRCFPGYAGKTCSQDVNECGMKPRPCQHRCVNPHGSYKYFCLSGHMLMPDATCVDSRTCARTNCQDGCEDTEEGPRCLCPSSGLRLAADGRVCIDIDECASGRAVCRYNRRCMNTFGSFYCKCHVGFELKYTRGRHDCVDINECALNTHACSLYANCLNTQGSFKCKCKQGYKGSGLQCSVIPEEPVKEILRAPGTIKDRIKKLLAHKKSMKKVKIKNVLTEPAGTPTPKVNLQQFSSKEGASTARNSSGRRKGHEGKRKEGIEEEEEDEKTQKNPVEQDLSLRGDVFSPKVIEADEFGLVLVQRKATTPKLKHKAVGYYMAVPGLAGHKKDIGRLKLLLPDLQPRSNFCLFFDYRLAGDKVGTFRVFVKNSNNVLAWEKRIIFEAERGKGKTGEIMLDSVLLVLGLCPDGLLSADG
ncbi:hypothetical protein MC885_013155 [Smutsia gigantea]|nr:hypothetical protein MC885_013155 [Smutsia gigantea]